MGIEGESMKPYVIEVELALSELIEKFYELKEREKSLSARRGSLVLIRGGLDESFDRIEDEGESIVGDSSDKVE